MTIQHQVLHPQRVWTQVGLLPAQFVRPFVKSNKNDYSGKNAWV